MRYPSAPLRLYVLIAGVCLGSFAEAQDSPPPAPQASNTTPLLPEDWVKEITWRSIGPANMSGRITAIAVNEQDPSTWWAASASGGLLKTTNNGATFEHQFDREATVSIGDVQVSRSDPNIVWVGTGEANPRNSASWGDGVYKSTDGGKTWKNMGLKKIFQTGRIAIHPENPDIVYVGALGRLWGPSEDRGLYKTTDGGKTWEKVLYIDDKTGVIDVQMNPASPDTLLVATYERQRDGFDGNDPAKKFGEGSGIYRTSDGGKTFTRMTQGLPEVKFGRVGLNIYRKDPNYVYAVIETEKIGEAPEDMPVAGLQGEDAEVGAKITAVTRGGSAEKAGLKVDDIVVSFGDVIIHSYADLQAEIRRHKAGEKVKVLASRERKTVEMEMELQSRTEAAAGRGGGGARGGRGGGGGGGGRGGRGGAGGGGGGSPFSQSLGGQQENLQDQQGDKGYNFGGVYRSTDGGQSWERINSLNPRPMYYSQIRVDPSDNNYVYLLGTSLYRSVDGGKTFTPDGHSNEVHVDHHALWVDGRDGKHIILGNDGGLYVTYDRMQKWDHHNHVAIGQFYHVSVDSQRAFYAYGGLQDNGSWGGPSMVRNDSGPVNTDWYRVGSGDGFVTIADPNDPFQIYFESQNGGMGRIHLKTGERGFIRPRAIRGVRYRFNWKAPYILSPHNTQIHYSAGNYVFRSVSKGDNTQAISPEISRTNEGAGSALSESAIEEGVLYAGTTDGGLWVTTDGGMNWVNLFDEPEKLDQTSEDQPPAPSSGGGEPSSGGQATAGGGPSTGGGGVRGGARFAAMLRQSDANKDGKIQRDELPGRMQALLTRFDTNGDGVIDEKELDAIAGPPPEGGTEDPPTEGEKKDPPAEGEKKDPPAEGEKKDPPAEGEKKDPPAEGEKKDPPAEGEKKDPPAEGEKKDPPTDGEAVAPATDPPTADGDPDEDACQEGEPERQSEQEPTESQEPAKQQQSEESEEANPEQEAAQQQPGAAQAAAPQASAAAPAGNDPVSGVWTGRMTNENLPAERRNFTLTLRMSADNSISGVFGSSRGEYDLTDGKFDPQTRKLTAMADLGQMQFEFTGVIEGTKFTGEMSAAGGQFQVPVEAERTGDAAAVEEKTAPLVEAKAIKDWLPGPRWVSSLEASKYSRGRCYMTLDGHRSNDDEPYVFATENYGRTWRSIRANLPTSAGSTRVIREDIVNADVLYLGCEFSCWVSIDRGRSWTRLNSNLPTVAVHEFAQHATSGEIVAGTHGRALWVADISLIRQLSEKSIKEDAHLYEPNTVVRWRSLPERGDSGTRAFKGQNPPSGAVLAYSLGQRANSLELTVSNLRGEVLYRGEELSGDPGLHVVRWDLTQQVAAPSGGRGGGRGGFGGGRGGFGGGRGRFGRRSVPNGVYLVTLVVNGNELKQELKIVGDPDYPTTTAGQELDLEDLGF